MVAGWASPPASPSFGGQTNRGIGAGIVILLLGAVLLPAAPALAQNQPIVSNLEESAVGSARINNFLAANPFTTGNRTSGYTLTEVVLRLGSWELTSLQNVSIYNASGSRPGTSIGTLAGPANPRAAGDYTYTSSGGITLAASTTYYLVAGRIAFYTTTASTDQTTTDGWDIANRVLIMSGSLWQNFLTTEAVRFSLSVQPFFDFGGRTIADQTYGLDTAIADLTLPAASGGSGNRSYMLEPDPPAGLSFSTATRVLSGTPTTAMAAAAYTYTATDTVSTSSTNLIFTITVSEVVRMRLRVFLEGPLE